MLRPKQETLFSPDEDGTLGNKDNIERSAVIDETGTYRYWLERLFPSGQQLVTFVLLNPSRADATRDDTTVTRCMGMAQLWGYQRLVIVNLFAFRTTYPSELLKAEAPIGPENGAFLLKAAQESDKVVLGWGMHGNLLRRDQEVLDLLSSYQLHCLGVTKGTQQPKHPSRLSYATQLVPYLRHEGANERDQLP
jgi:hypothetical protein